MPDVGFFEEAKRYLPKYLSPEDTSELFADLASFPHTKRSFYLQQAPTADPLQGDGWRGFVAVDFVTADRREVSGLVISNSCDIDPANRRDRAINILFSPLVQLAKYVELLRKVRSNVQVEDNLTAIRNQRIASIFYLPAGVWGAEGIVLL